MHFSKQSRYEDLFLRMIRCEKCFPREKKLLLPGTGNLDSKIMCIGEAPSKHRNFNETFGMKSKPIFEEFLKRCGLTRNDVWITNVVKCIILHEKTGDPEKCKEFILEEIDIVDPELIILFGKTATKAILGENHRFGEVIRTLDRVYYCVPHPMVCIYRPAEKENYMRYADKIRSIVDSIIRA